MIRRKERLEKSYANWDGGGRDGAYDVFRSLPEPTYYELIKAEEETVASCVRLITNKVCDVELRLYTTGREEGRSLKNVSPLSKKRITAQRGISPLLRKHLNFDEVTNHSLLDLLAAPNEHHSYTDLVRIVQRCLEVTGNAFVFISFENGMPVGLYPLPVQNVRLLRSNKTGATLGYEFQYGTEKAEFSVDEIIHFVADQDLLDIYGLGISPLRMVWQKVQLGRKDTSYWEYILTNAGRPDVVITPKDDSQSFQRDQKERIVKDFVQAFRGGMAGYPLVIDGSMSITPLTYAPKDMASFELSRQLKTLIANAFGVPMTLLEMADSNRASATAGNISFTSHTIKPRVTSLVSKLNRCLVPYFGHDLFLAPDDFIPEDKEFALQEDTALFDRQSLTINELREKRGYDPLPGGDKVVTPQAPSFLALPTQAPETPTEAKAADDPPEEPETPAKLVDALKGIFARQAEATIEALKDFDLNNLKGKPVLTAAQKMVPHYEWKVRPEDDFLDLSHWTEEMARELNPVLEPLVTEAAQQMTTRLRLSPSIGKVVQPRAREACEKLTLQFCKATNTTTSLLLSDALQKLREELGDAIEAGEVRQQITKRVQSVFEDASAYRAERIAATESFRARNVATHIVATESGVVKKKYLIVASNGCEQCKAIARKGAIEVDTPFAKVNDGPYGEPQTPPIHVLCRCQTGYDVDSEG